MVYRAVLGLLVLAAGAARAQVALGPPSLLTARRPAKWRASRPTAAFSIWGAIAGNGTVAVAIASTGSDYLLEMTTPSRIGGFAVRPLRAPRRGSGERIGEIAIESGTPAVIGEPSPLVLESVQTPIGSRGALTSAASPPTLPS